MAVTVETNEVAVVSGRDPWHDVSTNNVLAKLLCILGGLIEISIDRDEALRQLFEGLDPETTKLVQQRGRWVELSVYHRILLNFIRILGNPNRLREATFRSVFASDYVTVRWLKARLMAGLAQALSPQQLIEKLVLPAAREFNTNKRWQAIRHSDRSRVVIETTFVVNPSTRQRRSFVEDRLSVFVGWAWWAAESTLQFFGVQVARPELVHTLIEADPVALFEALIGDGLSVGPVEVHRSVLLVEGQQVAVRDGSTWRCLGPLALTTHWGAVWEAPGLCQETVFDPAAGASRTEFRFEQQTRRLGLMARLTDRIPAIRRWRDAELEADRLRLEHQATASALQNAEQVRQLAGTFRYSDAQVQEMAESGQPIERTLSPCAVIVIDIARSTELRQQLGGRRQLLELVKRPFRAGFLESVLPYEQSRARPFTGAPTFRFVGDTGDGLVGCLAEAEDQVTLLQVALRIADQAHRLARQIDSGLPKNVDLALRIGIDLGPIDEWSTAEAPCLVAEDSPALDLAARLQEAGKDPRLAVSPSQRYRGVTIIRRSLALLLADGAVFSPALEVTEPVLIEDDGSDQYLTIRQGGVEVDLAGFGLKRLVRFEGFRPDASLPWHD